MIIVDFNEYKEFKKTELIKLLIHSMKCCLLFNWTLTFKFKNKYIKMTPDFLQKFLHQKTKIVIILKPFTRLNLINLQKLTDISQKIDKPTLIISDIIYHHLGSHLNYVHLPEYSPELIRKFDYTKEIGIYLCLDNWQDFEKVDLVNSRKTTIEIKKISLPLKTIKKFHTYSDLPVIRGGLNEKLDYEQGDNLMGQKISVVIPSALQYMITTNFSDSTSSFSRLIEQVSNNLSALIIEFEIIVIVGPEVNKDNLAKALNGHIKFICLTDEQDFNFSRRVNLGLQAAQFDLIWLLNDDIKIIDDLSTLKDLSIAIELVNRNSSGFVGTFLLDSQATINHAGIQIYGEIADHYLRGTPYTHKQAMNLFKVREVIGVTGANVFFSKNLINKIGYWDESYPNNFNDLEMSLRAKEHGLENYVIKTNNFIHFESKTRNNKIVETEKLFKILNQYKVKAEEDSYKFTIPNCCF